MKCLECGKKLDPVDCECLWCTFCGTIFDVAMYSQSQEEPEIL